MDKSLSAAFLLAFVVLPARAADVRLDLYRNPKSETFRQFNQLTLDGVRSGLLSYNALLKRRGGQPMFCLPGNFVLTSEQAEEILLASAEKRSAKGDMLIAPLLLWGLRDRLPCEGGR